VACSASEMHVTAIARGSGILEESTERKVLNNTYQCAPLCLDFRRWLANQVILGPCVLLVVSLWYWRTGNKH